jgi:hypothetical protein
MLNKQNIFLEMQILIEGVGVWVWGEGEGVAVDMKGTHGIPDLRQYDFRQLLANVLGVY